MKKYLSLLIVGIIFVGCAGEINPSQYKPTNNSPIIVPNICKSQYNMLSSKPRVAVLRWSNNSNFAKARVSDKHSNNKGAAGLLVGSNGVGAGFVHTNNTNYTNRIVDPKLDKAITSVIEGMLAQMGVVSVYARSDLDKLIKEQKLEHSGLFDDSTITKLGKLSGVQYIITGSIDAVSQKYRDYAAITGLLTSATKTKDDKTLLAKVALNIGAIAASGMRITTTMTFKVIDTTTGKIVFSKQLTQSTNIGRYPHPSYSQIIGAIKMDMIKASNQLKPSLSQIFPTQGYIIQVKKHKDNYIALINIGKNDGVFAGEKFEIYKFSVLLDPIKHTQICEKHSLDTILTISKNQLQSHLAWGVLDGDDIRQVRPGEIIQNKGE